VALLPTLESIGLRVAGGDSTFVLWMDAGAGADALAARWLDAGIVVAPGSFFGAPRYLRIALVPTPEACARAAEIIRDLA
jgi:acetylornithine aminotransferase